MTKQEIINTLSIIKKEDVQKAIQQIDKEGFPKNRRSFKYDVKDPDTENLYPPPYLIDLAYKFATNNKLPSRFFDGIKKDSGHFDHLKKFGYVLIQKETESNSFFYILTRIKSEIQNAGFNCKTLRENSRYVWIEDSNNIIGRKPAHYEIIARGNKIYLELHFEEAKSKDEFFRIIKYLPKELEWFDWNGSKSIRHKNVYTINDQKKTFTLVKDLIEFDLLIGDRIRSILGSKSKKYWLYAPGENANKWDEFREEGIMALGWDDLGDLNHYNNKKEIADKLRLLENTEGSKKNDATANYDIYKTIEIGDIVIAKRGVKEYLGYGVVQSDYFYNDARTEFKSCRKVDWKSNGIWPETVGEIVAKTLTDITKYPDYVERLQELLCIDLDIKSDFNVWIEKSITKNRIDREEGPLKLGSALWSPTKDKRGGDIYSEMRMVKPGDVVLHLIDNKGIQGVSIVNREYTVGKGAENTAWDTDAYIVELKDYIQLPELFDRSLFLNEKNRKELNQINDNHKVFYNKNLDLNQGAYLTESPPELTGILCRSYFEAFQKQLPHLNNTSITTTDKLEPMNNPINTILFGPPGTGKTYKLKTEYFPEYISKNTEVSRETRIQEVLKNLTWWQVIAIVLLDLGEAKAKDIYNHEFVKLKEKLTTSKTVYNTISGKLQAHTVDNCELVNVNRKLMPLIFYKKQGAIWTLDQEGFDEIKEEIIEYSDLCKDQKGGGQIQVRRYEFLTFHQSYAYEDFIEGIKPVIETEGDGELRYEIKDGIFKELCQRAKNDPENKYAIFIDEINRGNVSSIFGELITLIELDKRLGMKNAMEVSLPYSREKFGVPSNVDIYGTMNTADRSVEALDTALRRRFSFEEMLPRPELLSEDMEGISLQHLLKCMNNRIEALIDRDHTIGHSYLINVTTTQELRLAFKDKIIPLLQEYFYGDYGKIGLVLGEGFVKVVPEENDLFASFDYDGRDGLTQNKFELINFNNDEEFKLAIKTLLKTTSA